MALPSIASFYLFLAYLGHMLDLMMFSVVKWVWAKFFVLKPESSLRGCKLACWFAPFALSACNILDLLDHISFILWFYFLILWFYLVLRRVLPGSHLVLRRVFFHTHKAGFFKSIVQFKLMKLMKLWGNYGGQVWHHVTAPSTTFPIVMRWFLIQIAQNIGNVVTTDQIVRTNGAPLLAGLASCWCTHARRRRCRWAAMSSRTSELGRRGEPPLVCKLLSVLTPFPLFYAICKRNHRIIKENVVEGTCAAMSSRTRFSKSNIAPLFFKMAQNLDLRCVLVSAPWVLGPKHVSIRPHYCRFMIGHSLGRMESRIKKFTPHCVCRYLDSVYLLVMSYSTVGPSITHYFIILYFAYAWLGARTSRGFIKDTFWPVNHTLININVQFKLNIKCVAPPFSK